MNTVDLEHTNKCGKRKTMKLVEILRDAGYKVVEGEAKVLTAIKSMANSNHIPRCSGYKIFPNGEKCKGCPDCASECAEQVRRENNAWPR